MPYDISEIKKLSTEEKLRIIDELWETIDEVEANEEEPFDDEDPEVVALLLERIEKYARGEGVFYTAEEALRICKQNLEEFRKKKDA
ncbi:MAG: addiction module protein [Segetibacter sp.]|nr:addiction module protein [Segetibacter sp.]